MLIVGLGNPGKEYANTHHNIGFIMVDKLAEYFKTKYKFEKKFQGDVAEFKYNGEKHYILKPQTYMNNSGISVKALCDYYKIDIDDIFVVYDDMDLPVGTKRIRSNGSSGGHNGIKSIIAHLGSSEFKRLRIGIGRSKDVSNDGVIHHVLSNFTKNEVELIQPIRDLIPDIVTDLLNNNIDYIMNKYN